MSLKFLAACTAASSLFSFSAFALGFRVADQNPEATARGDAFAATADNPSAIYYNPAGITQLEGTRALLGGYGISLKERVSLDTPGSNRSFASTNTEFQYVPQFYFTWKPKGHPIALGLGVYAPFGFAIEYPDDTPFRTLAHKGSLKYVTINPVAAWQLTNTLSIAAGPTVSYGTAELERGVFAVGDRFRFEGEGVAYGFNAGILWNPHPMHHLGLTYRSETAITFTGHSSVRTDPFSVATPFGPFTVPGIDREEDADATFHLPQVIVVGYSFRPREDWNFEFNLDWTDWETLDVVTLHQKSGNVALPFNWRSSFLYEFGVTKKFSHGISASVGYIYSENSVPNETFNPIIPDSNRHVFVTGISQHLEKFNWAIAYEYAYGPRREINQGTFADGTYRFESHAVTLSVGYNF